MHYFLPSFFYDYYCHYLRFICFIHCFIRWLADLVKFVFIPTFRNAQENRVFDTNLIWANGGQ